MVMRPAFPFMEYLLDYEYISNVLCENKDVPEMSCNGKCYLMKSLAEASEKESSQKKKNNSASIELLPFILVDSASSTPAYYLEYASVDFPIVLDISSVQTFNSLLRPPIA